MGAVVWVPVLHCTVGAASRSLCAFCNGKPRDSIPCTDLRTMAAASLHEPLQENQCRAFACWKDRVYELFRRI
jgi:hypothetical protein